MPNSVWEKQFKSQQVKCECGSIINLNNKYSHCKTKQHINTIKKNEIPLITVKLD